MSRRPRQYIDTSRVAFGNQISGTCGRVRAAERCGERAGQNRRVRIEAELPAERSRSGSLRVRAKGEDGRPELLRRGVASLLRFSAGFAQVGDISRVVNRRDRLLARLGRLLEGEPAG